MLLLNLYFLNLFRLFLECVNGKKARASNINCVVKTDVRHDGSEPVVDIMFGKEFIVNLKDSHWKIFVVVSCISIVVLPQSPNHEPHCVMCCTYMVLGKSRMESLSG